MGTAEHTTEITTETVEITTETTMKTPITTSIRIVNTAKAAAAILYNFRAITIHQPIINH